MNKNNQMSKRLLNYIIVLLVCLISSAESFAQGTKFQVKGNVTDASREPIVGATIKVKGTSQGVITNIDGEYSIDTRSNAILEFSYIGYVSQEVPVSGSKIINVTLQEEVSKLDEVVVVGYGTQKKISVTGSVSNVSTKEIAKIATPSLSNTLGGQIPGIVTRQATGEPGYDQASIYIRGFGTWTNRSPLILVDGIERDMNTINTEEVESISVLKDASATAVYGVRGANGVILITTKRGQLGKPKVTLRSEYAVLTGLRYPEYINAAEYAGLMNEARDNAGVANMAYTDEEIELFRNGSSPYLYPNVNWVDEVLKKNTTQSITNLNITGGTEVVRYFVNVGYTTQSGLYRDNGDNAYSTNSRVNRYNYRSRVDVNLTKDLSVELGVGGIIQNRNFPGKSQYDIFYAIRNTSPLAFPVKNPDGTPGASPTYLGNNPWGMTTQSGYETQNWNTLQGTFSARWDLSSLVTEGLSVSGRFAYDHYYSNNKQYYKDFEVKQYMGEDAEGNAIYNILRNENIKNVTLAESANRAIYYEVAANYDRTFGMHNITGMFLFNRRDYVNLRNTDRTGSVPYRRQGIAGRASYNYLQRYFAEFNFGYNGSEQFPKGSHACHWRLCRAHPRDHRCWHLRWPGHDLRARHAQRCRQEGRRHGKLQRGRSLGRLYPRVRGCRHDRRRRGRCAFAREARGHDLCVLRRPGHDRHPRRHPGRDHRRHHRRRDGHRCHQQQDHGCARDPRHRQGRGRLRRVRRPVRPCTHHAGEPQRRHRACPPRWTLPGAAELAEELAEGDWRGAPGRANI